MTWELCESMPDTKATLASGKRKWVLINQDELPDLLREGTSEAI